MSSFLAHRNWILGGLAAGLTVGGILAAIKSSFRAAEESERFKKCKRLAKYDFFRFQKNILKQLTMCPSIKFTVAELKAIYEKFYSLIDDEGKGSIRLDTLRRVYEEVYAKCNYYFQSEGKNKAKYAVDRMVKAFDRSEDFVVDFVELVQVLNGMAFDHAEKRMTKLFKLMDADQNGTLSPEELQTLVDLTLPSFTQEQKLLVLKRIQNLDEGREIKISGSKHVIKTTGDGQISMKEWMNGLHNFGFEVFAQPTDFEVSLLEYFGVKRI